MRGRITLTPSAITDQELALTRDGAHIWRPFAPTSHIKVDLNGEGWQWDGHGYFDANFGTRALEEDFSYWTWGTYRPLEIYTFLILEYLVLILVVSYFVRKLENKLKYK